jgi:hypothetical protein
LTFHVQSASVVARTLSPLIALTVRLDNADAGEEVDAVLLSCQVRIDAERRSYDDGERERLGDVFGGPAQWGRSLRGLLWTHASATVAPFREKALVDLHLPCSSDLSVGAAKYFYSLAGGQIPLTLQFSGTIFYKVGELRQVARIPWDCEATFHLDVAVWKEMMAEHYAGNGFVSLRTDVLDRLYRYRVREGLPTWDHAVERLLAAEKES